MEVCLAGRGFFEEKTQLQPCRALAPFHLGFQPGERLRFPQGEEIDDLAVVLRQRGPGVGEKIHRFE